MTKREEIETAAELAAHLERSRDLHGHVLQGVDLRGVALPDDVALEGAIFLGCRFADRDQAQRLIERGAAVFPELPGLPYLPYRKGLYDVAELLEGYEGGGYTGTRDFRIFTHYDRARRHPEGVPLREALAQRLHDLAIDDALEERLATDSGAGVVGVMGGHGTPRSDPWYAEVARAAWRLTREGYLIASGGGPGVMEAANLGAWLAGHDDPAAIDEAVAVLRRADVFSGREPEGTPAYLRAIEAYFARAREVADRLAPAEPGRSLAIPTWFYGHEPTNLFATWVAKYFSNSLREDGLLAIATSGVIYAPGSAGTLQEVFVDLAQNHYATYAVRSPMVFLGAERYGELVALLRRFVAARGMDGVYGDLIHLTESAADAAAFVRAHPPRPAERKTPLYDLVGGGGEGPAPGAS